MNKIVAPVVTLDGPAGSGKGAVGQRLAIALGWHFLDSGALYRACAYVIKQDQVDPNVAVKRLCASAFATMPDLDSGDSRVLLDGVDITSEVRTSSYGESASKLAAKQELRTGLLEIQRNMRRLPGLIADGRDMGTMVFPDAVMKVYLSADLQVRAQRKHEQLKQMGNYVKLEGLYQEMKNRDSRDSTREHAPLSVPAGAFTLDTTHMTLEQVVRTIANRVSSALA